MWFNTGRPSFFFFFLSNRPARPKKGKQEGDRLCLCMYVSMDGCGLDGCTKYYLFCVFSRGEQKRQTNESLWMCCCMN